MRKRLPKTWILLLALCPACGGDDLFEGHFDGPVAAAVLQPEDGSPFDMPVAFVSNSRSGRIIPLDLKYGRVLSDDPAASFLRASYIATGRLRTLGDVAVLGDASHVTLFAGDTSHEGLVEAPYVIGVEGGYPVEVTPSASEPVFVDADASGDSATLEDLELRAGFTTTETWVIAYDGSTWWATGSRSGAQYESARFDEEYHTGWREIQFTLRGTATAGDRFELETSNLVVEHDVGGIVQAMSLSPDKSLLALSVFDRDTGLASLVIFDPAKGASLGAVPLDKGSQPWRLAWNDVGDILYVADASLPMAWEVLLDSLSPAGSTVRSIPTAAPVADLAWKAGDGYANLYVAPAGLNRVDIYDLLTESWLDANPYTGEVAGLDLYSPVVGISAVPIPVETLETTSWGARLPHDAIAVSLAEGEMVVMDAQTGCLLQDALGPRSSESSTDTFDFIDMGATSDAYIWQDEATGTHVQVNQCGGVARSETWTAFYDEVQQAWWLEGQVTGEQVNMAYNDIRYVSDAGEVSFTIMAGTQPYTDGDSFLFTVDSGLLFFDADIDHDGTYEVEAGLELPGRPVSFWYDVGGNGGGWDQVDRRVYTLLPITNSDIVGRCRLSSGQTEVLWD